ncbi:MAG: thioredoxin domain-containing protein [Roseburia sp.]|nr:thioredoxin domain-containing protein [Roseburia sp.]
MNHLSHEKSPYLLQHALNPVDWYPWGTEAFERAKREDKPVFLSIGYSTCHWCHVMAHESFEDEEVAKILNQNYISIKVDREERPEIDAVYMSVCQAVTGSGGWPLTACLTPEQEPFFVGTYFPKYQNFRQPGLVDILLQIASEWKQNRQELLRAGNRLVKAVFQREPQNSTSPEDMTEHDAWGKDKTSLGALGKALCRKAADLYAQNFDRQYGGFGTAPKFPIPHNLFFLMRYSQAENGQKDALFMVERTLRAMADGGIFDHIGGGFSRYSTDEKWMIPHFEKMLYDNALLAIAYLEFYGLKKDGFYKKVAIQTLDYILNELVGPDGEFFCGQDADSEGVEGKYYYFTPKEVYQILGEERGREFCTAYGITEAGNFEGKSVPNRIGKIEPVKASVEKDCARLYEYRKERTKLHLDDKVILSWNAWTILAMAKAYRILGVGKYRDAAGKAHRFIRTHMEDQEHRLFLRWREGEAAFCGNLDDYAVYGIALIELYGITYDPVYLKEAVLRAQQMTELFEDRENGGYYLTASDAEKLIARPKETYDGALPSGNSAAAVFLLRLSEYTGEEEWRSASERQNRYLAGIMEPFPYGHSFGLTALMESLMPSDQLICVSAESQLSKPLEDYLAENPWPGLQVLFKTAKNAKDLEDVVTFLKNYPIPEEGCMYYLCRDGKCEMPGKDFLGKIFPERAFLE